VTIGGLSIYLGYRLFLSMPQTTDAEGRFKLPWNTSIVLSRVGPGVFFALFGSLIVGSSFFRSIQYSDGAPVKNVNPGAPLNSRFVGSTQSAEGNDTRHDARMLLQRDISILNSIPGQLDPKLEAHNRSSVEFAIHRTKLALMETVWGDWGERGALKDWMESPDLTVPAGVSKEAVEYYRLGMKEKR
jgi:hypothetical protein